VRKNQKLKHEDHLEILEIELRITHIKIVLNKITHHLVGLIHREILTLLEQNLNLVFLMRMRNLDLNLNQIKKILEDEKNQNSMEITNEEDTGIK